MASRPQGVRGAFLSERPFGSSKVFAKASATSACSRPEPNGQPAETSQLGHDVTLFASGDSITKAKLEPCVPSALRLDMSSRDYLTPHILMLERIARAAEQFDILHLHIDCLGYSLMSRLHVPFLTTLHGRLDLPALPAVYALFDRVPVVSISNAQRMPLPEANYAVTIYHGLPPHLRSAGPGSDGYLAFLGRVSPEKAPDAAIRIAMKAGMRIKLAAIPVLFTQGSAKKKSPRRSYVSRFHRSRGRR